MIAAGNPFADEFICFCQRRIRLGYDELILGIRGQEVNLIRHEGHNGHLGAKPGKALAELGIDDFASLGDLLLRLGIDNGLAEGPPDQGLIIAGKKLVHFSVGRLDKAILINAGKGGQAPDEADVRTFRRLNRADASVVGMMHIADVKAGALAPQTAGTQSGECALVPQLRQRIGLVHELTQLAGPKELPQRGYDRPDVHQRHR